MTASMAITLTPAAAERVRHFLAERGHGVGLRLGVRKTGCSGFAYVVNYADSVEPLLTRLRARVGRPQQLRRMGLEVGPYSLDAAASAVRRDDQEISLTAREFALAWVLFSNAGRVVSASSLTARVWGGGTDICKRTLEQHVYRLRRKLSGGATGAVVRIQAIYSIGYRLDLLHEQPLAWAMPDYGSAATAQLPLHARGLPQEQPPGYLRHLWPGEF